MGVWRLYERERLELLDCRRFHDSLRDHATPATRLFDGTELVQHDSWHLDVLLAVDIRIRCHQYRTLYQQSLCGRHRIRIFDYLGEN